jgi:glucosamine--fructose-6-phosphate aminotransferase (isomerizing)
MLEEIKEQPKRLRETLELENEKAREIGKEIKKFSPECVMVVARGTSDNAATYARYLIQYENRLPVASAAPSLYTFYDAKFKLDKTLVIGISQSGETPDVVYCIKKAREDGALTCAITNTEDSPLEEEAHLSLIARSGKEEAVAATKTFTTSLLAVALLSFNWAGDEEKLEELNSTPAQAEKMLSQASLIEEIVQRYTYVEVMSVISRGFSYPTALEIALKIRETALVDADGFSSADFMHGPVAVVRKGFPLFFVVPKGKVLEHLIRIAEQLRKRGAEIIALSNSERMRKIAHSYIPIPFEGDETILPITSVIGGQLFAYYLAVSRGLNPDKPRGLRKVTRIW